MSRKLFDISPRIDSALQVFPGDTPPVREVRLDLQKGDAVTLSTLHATVHLGAHLDAPSHYGRDGRTIDALALAVGLGPCQVVRVAVERGGCLAPERIDAEIRTPRVLFATGTFPDPTRWNDDFAAVAPECIDWLADQGVRLVGIDTPSIDPAASKALPAHRRALARDLAILEGIVLTDVPAGAYELIALPLRLVGFDASPVRAVLRELG